MLPKLPSQVIHRRHVSNGGGKEVDGKTTKGLVQGHVAPGRRGVFDTFSVPRLYVVKGKGKRIKDDGQLVQLFVLAIGRAI